MTEVTDADREAATQNQRNMIMRVGSPAEAFAHHRAAAEQAGYDRAIAEVVAWLRDNPRGMLEYEEFYASAIEAGEHRP